MAPSWETPAGKRKWRHVLADASRKRVGAPPSILRAALSGMPARMLAVLVLCSGGLVALLLVIETPKPVPLVPRPTAAPPAVAPPVKAKAPPTIQAVVPAHLMSPASAAALPLRRHARLGPAALCATIDLGADSTGWTESPVYPGEWECLSRTPETSPDSGFSLFVMARGKSPGDMRYLRFKLSQTGAGGTEAGGDLLVRRIVGLFDTLGWALPDGVPRSIHRLEPFEIDDAGTTLRFARESSGENRYNLIVTFAEGTIAAAADPSVLIPSEPEPAPKGGEP